MAANSSPSREPTQDASSEVPESSQTSDSHQTVQGSGSGKKSARETPSSSGLLNRLKSAHTALDRGIDWAKRCRQADCDYQLRWESIPEEAESRPAVPPVSTTHVRVAPLVSFPETVTTRSSVMDSLPAQLVRGGMGAWLGLGIIIVIGLISYAASQVTPVFIGLFMALVFTSILQPMVNLFAKIMPRYPTTFLALFTVIGAIAGLITYVVTSATSRWSSLASQFGDDLSTIMDFLENGLLHLTQQQIYHQFQLWLRQEQHYLQSNAPSLASELLSNASAVIDVLTVLAPALFVTTFLLASGGRMWCWFLNELPVTVRESTYRAAGTGWYTFAGYARGTVPMALTDAIMAGILLQLVGIPLVASLAVLVFIGASIPIIGAPLAMLVAMVVVLASGGFVTMIVVGVGVAGVGQVEGHVLQPLIMGRQVSLHPMAVITGVALGTYAADPLSAIVAVPLISVLWSVYSELHTKNTPVTGELPAYSSRKEWGAPLLAPAPAAGARDTGKGLETIGHERDDSVALLHGAAYDESDGASADASVATPHTGSAGNVEQTSLVLQAEEDHAGSSVGALPVGDDVGDAHPVPMLLICQVGYAEHAVNGQ